MTTITGLRTLKVFRSGASILGVSAWILLASTSGCNNTATVPSLSNSSSVSSYDDQANPTPSPSPSPSPSATPMPGPSITLSSTAQSPTKLSPIPITVSFSAPVTGFSLSSLTLVNATASGLAGSGATYSFDLYPNSEGTVQATVSSGAATDAGGNPSRASSPLSLVYDVSSPTVTLSANTSINRAPIPMNVTFSKPVSGFSLSSLSLVNATATNLTGSGANYTFTLTPVSGPNTVGEVQVSVNAGAATDSAGNSSLASAVYVPGIQTFLSDWTRALIGGDNTVPLGGWYNSYLSNASASQNSTLFQRDPTSLATPYHFPAARIEVRPGQKWGTASGERSEMGLMVESPAVPVNEDQTSGTQYYALSYLFPLDWQSTATDMNGTIPGNTCNGGGKGSCNGLTWSVIFQLHGPDALSTSPSFALSTVTDLFGNAIFRVSLNAGNLSDSTNTCRGVNGIPLDDGGSMNLGEWNDLVLRIKYAQDNTGRVTLWRRRATGAGDVGFTQVLDLDGIPTLQYKPAVNTSAGHYWKQGLYRGDSPGYGTSPLPTSLGGLLVNNVLWTGPLARATTFAVAEKAAFGTSAGALPASDSNFKYQGCPPQVAGLWSSSVVDYATTNLASFPVSVLFSTPVTNFSLAGISLVNATASNLAGSGTSYSFTVTPASPGQVRVSIKGRAAKDASGNGNVPSPALVFTYAP